MLKVLLVLLLAGLGLAGCSQGGEGRERVHVAVAANMLRPMAALEQAFEAGAPYDLVVSAGASGALAAQVEAGAPFDVLLSADTARPDRLEARGLVAPGGRRTYAIGRLVLWNPAGGETGPELLDPAHVRHLAIANPALAPYGAAAEETLAALGVLEPLRARLVLGENIGQAFTFVETGNAGMGFIALSQFLALPEDARGGHWLVPDTMHAPIRQDAVLIARSAGEPGARAFFDFLAGDEARAILEGAGYSVP